MKPEGLFGNELKERKKWNKTSGRENIFVVPELPLMYHSLL